jgi:hypothetical protein
MEACIVVPVYRPSPTWLEVVALSQLARRLGAREVELVAPEGFVADAYFKILGHRKVQHFDARFFRSREGGPDSYSALLVSEPFYDRFERYEHIVIHQPDVFVFTDQLDHWTAFPFDYVGPPHWKGGRATLEDGIKGVGNGGFSLRRVESFRRVLRDRSVARRMAEASPGSRARALRKARSGKLIEDFYWSYAAPITVATLPEAIAFGFEMGVPLIAEYRQGLIPFGCHAEWNVSLIANYWRGTPENRAPEVERILYGMLERSGNGLADAIVVA